MHRFAFVVSAVALCGQTTPPAATGSISGVVQYENGKAPEAGIVRISPGGYEIKLDDKGHYSQHDLKPGTYHISAETNRGWGPSGSRLVALGTGQDMTADLRLRPNAGITGRVLDENKEPVAGASVFLIAREYQLGELRYVRAFVEQTNDQGEYMVAEVPPDRGYLLLAKKTVHEVPPISDSPVDVKLRKRILIPTYYPGVDSVEGAEVVTLSSGERREGMDIRMYRSASYCIEAVLAGAHGPVSLMFFLEEKQPTDGEAFGRGMYMVPTQGTAGADGRIRVCDQHPGDYRLAAFDLNQKYFGAAPVTITDGDALKVRVNAVQRVPVPGEVVWDGKAPEKPIDPTISISLAPAIGRTIMNWPDLQAKSSVPGEFSFDGLFAGDYPVKVRGLPDNLYVKDITYGGRSVLHKPLSVGSAIGKATLRIVVSPDGGRMEGRTADKNGNPTPDCFIAVIAASADTEAEMSSMVDFEITDQNGAWSTHRLAPGKYYVVASQHRFDLSPEGAARLWHSRMSAHEVDLGPGATEQVTVEPMAE